MGQEDSQLSGRIVSGNVPGRVTKQRMPVLVTDADGA